MVPATHTLLALVTLALPIGAVKVLITFQVEPLNCHSRLVPLGRLENASTFVLLIAVAETKISPGALPGSDDLAHCAPLTREYTDG